MLGVIWRPAFRYSKGGIMLAELAMAVRRQLFLPRDPVSLAALMLALDGISVRRGRGTLMPWRRA